MTKRQVIDNILEVNASADPGFLSQFEREDLNDYLRKLHTLAAPRLTGGATVTRTCEPSATLNDFLADVEPAFARDAQPAPCPATRPTWRDELPHVGQLELDIVADAHVADAPTADPQPEPVAVGAYVADEDVDHHVPAEVAVTDDADQMAWMY